jgi:hypothetical protein
MRSNSRWTWILLGLLSCPASAAAGPVEALEDFKVEEGFTSLFNDKDLSGWKLGAEFLEGKTETTDRRFAAKDSAIVIQCAPEKEDLYTTREFNQDFVLRLEFRAGPKANSGLHLRGTQLQVRDYPTVGPYKTLRKFNAGGWNAIEVKVRSDATGPGAVAECTCNGEMLEPALRIPARGGIGLQSETGKLEYRRIRIKEQPRAAQEQLSAPGLQQSVEILRDRWGIAHIYAKTEHDMFFAQGFSAARDRLFQLELWRRQATGTMAEIQGPEALQADIGARLLSFRGDLDQELAHYHPRGAEIIGAFVEGINAYIDLTEREPSRLPLSFGILGLKPGKWTTRIVVSRHNGLGRNATQELANAQLVGILGSEKARELLNLHPGQPDLTPDPSLNLAVLPKDLLKLYEASHAVVQFRPKDVQPEFRGTAQGPEAGEEPFFGSLENDNEFIGSNNWVVSGQCTISGKGFMANDPHRAMLLPSLRYFVHLVGPGWDCIGGGEPALPGVAIGHNPFGAWGLTIFPIDQEDLYVYETDPQNPARYRYRGQWEAMRVVPETFAVKGKKDAVVNLKFTRHGPVLYEDVKNQKAYGLRAARLEIGTDRKSVV